MEPPPKLLGEEEEIPTLLPLQRVSDHPQEEQDTLCLVSWEKS